MVYKIAADSIISEIEERLKGRNGPLIVALDGKSGSGKTTTAQLLINKFDAVDVRCDDFFTGKHDDYWAEQTTQYKIDNVIEWKRIKQEVIVPLKEGKTAKWHPFNWKTYEGLSSEFITVKPRKVVILDGAFSNRPELRSMIDFSILVQAPDRKTRVNRVSQREGEKYSEDWHKVWEESMNYYFEKISPPETFDLVVQN